MNVCGHVGENVCLTVLLFDGLSVHPFVCSYTVLCMFLSVCRTGRHSVRMIMHAYKSVVYKHVRDIPYF